MGSDMTQQLLTSRRLEENHDTHTYIHTFIKIRTPCPPLPFPTRQHCSPHRYHHCTITMHSLCHHYHHCTITPCIITAPSLHHHHAPSLHHHCTHHEKSSHDLGNLAPHLFDPDPQMVARSAPQDTLLVSLQHHCIHSITASSLHHHCNMTVALHRMPSIRVIVMLQ